MSTAPSIGTMVCYRCATHSGQTRPAVVIGYSTSDQPGGVHLAVLTNDGNNLDLMSLSVPHDPAAVTTGSWHHQTRAECDTDATGAFPALDSEEEGVDSGVLETQAE